MVLPYPPSYTTPIPNNPFYSPETYYLQGWQGPIVIGSNLNLNAAGVLSASGGGGGGGVTTVSGTAPIVVIDGSTAPVISITNATTSAVGAVQLATLAEVTAGVNNNHAVTPDTLAAIYMPKSGGTFTGPVTFDSSITANGVSRFNGDVTTVGTVTNCGAVTNCSTVTTVGATTNIGPVTNCALVTNCDNVITCGTTTNVGQVTNCALVTNCSNVVTNGTTTNIGNVTNCGTTTMCGPTTFCNTATFSCPATFCCPVTFCQPPIYPAGVALGCAACVTYSNTTSGLAATNVQAAIDEVNAKIALPATTSTLGVVCIGSNINVTPAGQISVCSASTTVPGVVQLYDGVDSSSTTQALTAAQGRVLQDQIAALSGAGGIELAGTFNASTSQLVTITNVGTSNGYTLNANLPAASATTFNSYVIITTPGTYTPPGGSTPYTVSQGDWLLVTEDAPSVYSWAYLNVGFDAASASTTVPGVVKLATNAQVQAGLDTANAVTSAALQSKLSDSVATPSSTTIASSAAVKTAYDLAALAIPKSAVTGKGALVSGTAASTVATLPVGADGQVLVACGAATTGLCWTNQSAAGIPCTCITAKGDIIAGTAANSPTALNVGTDGQMLVACSGAITGLCWIAPPAAGIPCATLNAKGALITTSSPTTPVALPVGTDGQILTACAAAATGLCWTANSAIPCSTLSAKGSLVAATAASTPANLPVGTDGQVLTADSTCGSGLKWSTVSAALATPLTAGTVVGCAPPVATYPQSGVLLGINAGACAVAGTGGKICGNIFIGPNAGVGTCTSTGSRNVAIGLGALPSFTLAMLNVAIGCGAMATATTASANVAVGMTSLYNNSTGLSNVAIGGGSLNGSTGTCNTALGGSAGSLLTSGDQNVFIGSEVQPPVVTGSCQLVIGFACGCNWLTGCANKNIRPGAGIIDCTGSAGTAGQVLKSNGANGICWGVAGGGSAPATPISEGLVFGCTPAAANGPTTLGANAGQCMLAGATGPVSSNTFIGNCSGYGVNAPGGGCYNVGVGALSLKSFTTGGYNVGLGASALVANTTGGFNVAVGALALCASTAATNNVGVGYCALQANTTGSNNVAVGVCALVNAQACSNNTALGACALAVTGLAVGSCIVAVGSGALSPLSSGCFEQTVAIGVQAAGASTGSQCSVYVGTVSGIGITGNNNVGVGYNTMGTSAAVGTQDGVAIGAYAMCLGSGVKQTAVGYRALGNAASACGCNTAIGWTALGGATMTGIGNTAVGACVGGTLTSGNHNLLLGTSATLSTGCGNVILGGVTSAGTYTPAFNITTESNRVVLGSGSVTNIYAAVSTITVSDARDKIVEGPVPHGLDFVNQLKPVTYHFKLERDGNEPHGPRRYGLLAQDVLALEGDDPVIINTEEEEKLRMAETYLIPVLIDAVKELSAQVDELKAKLKDAGL